MSTDETFIMAVLRALQQVGLEAIIIGNTAAALQGAPVMTQDLDLLVRETPKNEEKIAQFCGLLGLGQPMAISDLTRGKTIVGGSVPIDLLFDRMAGDLSFEAVRSRSNAVPLGDTVATVACLDDVIKSKETADRPKDRAVLPILRDTLRVKQALAAAAKKGH